MKQFGWSKIENNYCVISYYDYLLKMFVDIGGIIVVIFVNGVIMDGEEMSGNVGGDIMVLQICDVCFDFKVKVIVLCVNSSGGSVNVFEVICVELVVVRVVGKLVVVLMGGMVVFGGYWIFMLVNYIVVSFSMLMGLIGIFGVINMVENSLLLIGVYSDGVFILLLVDILMIKVLLLEVQQMM